MVRSWTPWLGGGDGWACRCCCPADFVICERRGSCAGSHTRGPSGRCVESLCRPLLTEQGGWPNEGNRTVNLFGATLDSVLLAVDLVRNHDQFH